MPKAATDGQRPSKRARLLSDEEDDSDSSSLSSSENIIETNGDAPTFKINEDYARRFEHNKKREELQRLEEKYGKDEAQRITHDDDDSSSSEDEDDNAELATRELDDEIAATLQAIRSKDKRVYDKDINFYNSLDKQDPQNKEKKAKPVTLQDYHRQNILSGNVASDDEDEGGVPLTADQEQQQLKNNLLNAADKDAETDDEENEDGFFKKRSGREGAITIPAAPPNVSTADNDAESYLSNFLAARAWEPQESSKWQAFESDDEEEEQDADKFEAAYNLRFEDPNRANEVILSHSRKAVADYTVRRDKSNARKRARDTEKEKKQEVRRQRDEEKSRMRNLQLEKASEKLKQFKDAAGLRSKSMTMGEWNEFLDAGWDSDQWDQQMQKRFNDQYYADRDDLPSDDAEETTEKSNKLKKPTWDDDIDIADIVPDFNPGQDAEYSLSEDENDNGEEEGDGEDVAKNDKQRRSDLKSKVDKKREARKERRKLEDLVDVSLSKNSLPASRKSNGAFRYRDTSPTSFGLDSRDILMADDSALNQYAGLKKLAAFRDAERKKKDKRKLGKSARLRQWRKETFGDETGPQTSFQEHFGLRTATGAGEQQASADGADGALDVDVVTAANKKDKKKKQKKRSRKRKVGEVEA